VVAEGVETEADRQRLVELGVGRMQGYLFARPLLEEEFVGWLAHHGEAAPSRVTLA
jgi:EAL domain-containing protein (putative c-di-GMP-specific phosphodiesterase class I)